MGPDNAMDSHGERTGQARYHVGLIPDGNRRWAQERGRSSREGHEEGARTVETVLQWAFRHPEIGEFSAYGLSEENFKRSEAELAWLFGLYEEKLANLLQEPTIWQEQVQVRIVSTCPERWPNAVRDLARRLHERTAGHSGKRLNVLLGYTGQSELRQAIRRPRNRIKTLLGGLAERDIERALLVPTPCDLVLRTGYEEAPREAKSGFLLWQTAYAEFQHIPKHFPDLTEADLDDAWQHFACQRRRLGT